MLHVIRRNCAHMFTTRPLRTGLNAITRNTQDSKALVFYLSSGDASVLCAQGRALTACIYA